MSFDFDPRVQYGLSCPEDGDFQICEDTEFRFIGCCDGPACAAALGGNCSGSRLFPASFSAAKYSDFLPQSCIEPYDESNWYTCMHATPPFIGCCKTNPCNGGCPDDDVIPARLSDVEEHAAQFLPPASSTSTTSTGVPATVTATADPSPTETETGSPSPTRNNTGLIVGLSMAGVAILLAVLGIYLWWRRREERRRPPRAPDSPGGVDDDDNDEPEMAARAPPAYVKDTAPDTPPTSQPPPSPYPEQGGFAYGKSRSPALSSPRTVASGSWAPSDVHSGHTSQLSELSSTDWTQMHDRTALGLQPVPELEGSGVVRPLFASSGGPDHAHGPHQPDGQH